MPRHIRFGVFTSAGWRLRRRPAASSVALWTCGWRPLFTLATTMEWFEEVYPDELPCISRSASIVESGDLDQSSIALVVHSNGEVD